MTDEPGTESLGLGPSDPPVPAPSGHVTWVRDLVSPGPRRLLAWQALTISVGVFLALAVMALYLVGPAGLGPRAAAVTLAGGAAASLLATIPAGRVIRRIGPQRFALLSTSTRAALFALLPFVRVHWAIEAVVVGIGIAQTAAFGIYQLITTQVLGEQARPQAVAVRRTVSNVGFCMAAGLTAAVVGIGTRTAYLAAFELSAGALAISAWFLLRLPSQARLVDKTHGSSRSALRDPRYILLILVASIMATSLSLLTIGVPLWVVGHTHAPRSIVGLLMALNAVLVIVFQVRLAAEAEHLRGARRSVVAAAMIFAVAMVVYALAGRGDALVAVIVLLLATVLASVGEMYDSAGWWTISYQLAPERHRGEYLAAFDAAAPIANIVGPPLMIGVVTLGIPGWLGYAGLFMLAATAARLLLPGRLLGRPAT